MKGAKGNDDNTMIYAENADLELCIICGEPMAWFKVTGWTCRICDT